LTVRRAMPPSMSDPTGTYHINLGSPPVVPGSTLVGQFHTHPSGSTHSEIDEQLARGSGIPEFVAHGNLIVDTFGLPFRGGNWRRPPSNRSPRNSTYDIAAKYLLRPRQ
jgi:hypothetical protein